MRGRRRHEQWLKTALEARGSWRRAGHALPCARHCSNCRPPFDGGHFEVCIGATFDRTVAGFPFPHFKLAATRRKLPPSPAVPAIGAPLTLWVSCTMVSFCGRRSPPPVWVSVTRVTSRDMVFRYVERRKERWQPEILMCMRFVRKSESLLTASTASGWACVESLFVGSFRSPVNLNVPEAPFYDRAQKVFAFGFHLARQCATAALQPYYYDIYSKLAFLFTVRFATGGAFRVPSFFARATGRPLPARALVGTCSCVSLHKVASPRDPLTPLNTRQPCYCLPAALQYQEIITPSQHGQRGEPHQGGAQGGSVQRQDQGDDRH